MDNKKLLRAAALEADATERLGGLVKVWIVMSCTKCSDLGTHLMPVEDKTVKFKMIVF